MQPRQIELRIKRIKRELTKLGPMRPGTLSMQYAACQKPGCACMDPVKPKKHGPFYQLSYSHLGKSTTRFVRLSYASSWHAGKTMKSSLEIGTLNLIGRSRLFQLPPLTSMDKALLRERA